MVNKDTVYEGTPKQIITRMTHELADVLHAAGHGPSGVHVIALLHLVASVVKSGIEDKEGQMPSFKSMLGILTHGVTGTPWSNEEMTAFDKEFQAIVESYGGRKITKDKPVNMMSPSLGIH